jgi:3-deoxy-D-manno-octulosonic acid kinase
VPDAVPRPDGAPEEPSFAPTPGAEPLAVGSHTLLLSAPERVAALSGWLQRYGTLMAAAEAHPEGARLAGRGRVARVRGPVPWEHEQWVVRHYHRGGAVARFLGDRYLRVGAPRPFREFRLLEALRSRGVPAPEPVGATVHRQGPFYRGDLVTRWVADSVDLATLLFDPETPTIPAAAAVGVEGLAAMRASGRLVRLLHERGLEHPDLNLKNILLAPSDPEPVALILDLDRAGLHTGGVPARMRRRMIARFWRSARKWERRTGRSLPASLQAAFHEGYAEHPGEAQAG